MSKEVQEVEAIYRDIKRDTQAFREGRIDEETAKTLVQFHNTRLRGRKVVQETREHVEYDERIAALERRGSNQPAFEGAGTTRG